jgi:hypothetical protein
MHCPGQGDRLPPPVDEHVVTPEAETREEMIRGRIVVAMPANAPHGDMEVRLSKLIDAHIRPGYIASADLLTRFAEQSDFATDVCIRRAGTDPRTGRRYLEEVACEIASEQHPGSLTEKAEDMAARGVRRIFAVFVKRGEVAEWRGEWQPVVGQIEDETLIRSLPVRAILDAAEADDAVVRALLAKRNPEITRVRIQDLCEVLGIELSPERVGLLQRMDAPGLQALLAHLKQVRAWPM